MESRHLIPHVGRRVRVSLDNPDRTADGVLVALEPRDNPDRQVEHLRRAGRTVVCVRVRPWSWRHRLDRWWRDRRYRMSR